AISGEVQGETCLHDDSVVCVRFNPAGDTVLLASQKGTITERHFLKRLHGAPLSFWKDALSLSAPAAKELLITPTHVKHWRVETNAFVLVNRDTGADKARFHSARGGEYPHRLTAIAFSHDGRKVAAPYLVHEQSQTTRLESILSALQFPKSIDNRTNEVI